MYKLLKVTLCHNCTCSRGGGSPCSCCMDASYGKLRAASSAIILYQTSLSVSQSATIKQQIYV